MADGNIYIKTEIDDKDAAKQLAKLNRDINKLENDISKGKTAELPIAQQLRDAQKAAIDTLNEVERLKTELATSERRTSVNGNVNADQFAAELEKQKELKAQIAEQEKLLAQQEKTAQRLETEDAKRLNKIAQQTKQLEQQKDAAGELTARVTKLQSVERLKNGFESVKKSITGGVRKLLLWGLAIRSTYALVRKLRTYLTEAVKSFAENDPETKAHVDALKNSLAGLKAQWGAAFGPILSTVAPLLQTLISWLSQAANAVAAFFAALGGKSTYKKAVTGLNGIAKAAGGAASAAKDAKKQLMGIDDLTIFQDNDSSGGAGSGSNVKYEDAEVGAGAQAFADKVKPIIEWMQDNLPFVLDMVKLIGAALLGWRIASAFPAAMEQIIGAVVILGVLVLAVKDYMDMWVNGIDWDKLIYYIGLVAIAAAVAAIAFSPLIAAVILLVGGIALIELAFHQWNETGELTNEMIGAIVAGILLIGAAIAIVIGWPALLAAAIVAALVFIGLKIYQKWDEIKQWWEENVAKGVREGWEEFKQACIDAWTWFINNVFTPAKEKFLAAIAWLNRNVVGPIGNAIEVIKGYWGSMIENLKIGWQAFVEWLGGIAGSIAQPFIDAINAILDAWNFIASRINSISFDFEQNAVTDFLGIAGYHFGLSVPTFDHIAWGARGGILDRATLIGAGEAGKEALIPLERNTEWVKIIAGGIADELASAVMPAYPAVAMGTLVPRNAYGSSNASGDLFDKLNAVLDAISSGRGTAGTIHTHIYLDRREIGEAVTQYQDEQERGRGW